MCVPGSDCSWLSSCFLHFFLELSLSSSFSLTAGLALNSCALVFLERSERGGRLGKNWLDPLCCGDTQVIAAIPDEFKVV